MLKSLLYIRSKMITIGPKQFEIQEQALQNFLENSIDLPTELMFFTLFT